MRPPKSNNNVNPWQDQCKYNVITLLDLCAKYSVKSSCMWSKNGVRARCYRPIDKPGMGSNCTMEASSRIGRTTAVSLVARKHGGSKKMSFMSPLEVRQAYAMQKAAWVAKLPKRVQTIMPGQSESLPSEFNSLGKRHISKRHISANIKDNIDANPNANLGGQGGPGRRSCRVPPVF